jgi:DNA-binding NtrC family response regulator
MSPKTAWRKVLIIEDQSSIGNVMYALLAALNCEGSVAHSGREGLERVRREDFDAVLMDLRCSNLQAESVVPQIHSIRPSLVGRVLVITGEAVDAKSIGLIERYSVKRVPASRPLHDVVRKLLTLFRPSPGITPAP